MDRLIIFLILLFIMLTAIIIYLIIYIVRIKKQIGKFSIEVDKLNSIDYNKTLKVDIFDKDLVGLASAINKSVENQKQIKLKYFEDKKRLRKIIAGISHDFRTPLTSAKGYLQMIKKKNILEGQESEYLEIAIAKTEYLKELSDEFFEVSKLEAGNEKFDLEEFNLCNLITEIILEQFSWIEDLKIKTGFNIPDETLMIVSNKHFLIRIFQNIFSNARKYATLKVGLDLEVKDGMVSIKIYNDIINNSQIDVNKVFDPFYRGLSRNKEGSGMGLYVVKCISDKLGIYTNAYIEKINGEDMFVIEISNISLVFQSY